MNKTLIPTSLGLVILLAALVLVSQARPQPTPSPVPQGSQPQITWSQSKIEETLFPGTNKTVNMRFRSSQDIASLVVETTPSLDGIVSTKPSSFTSIIANRDYEIAVKLSAPAELKKRSFGGTIHLRNDGKPSRTFADPLQTKISTQFSTFSGKNVTFAYPVDWNVKAAEDGSIITILSPQADPDSEDVAIDFTFHSNPKHLSVDAFFNGINGPDFYSGASITTITVGGRSATKFLAPANESDYEIVVIPTTNGFWALGTLSQLELLENILASFSLN
jgi:hypothetical protein